ncbi:MAG: DHH family phosphoesterase, partial [Endomicrobiia bacterium]
GSQLALYIWLKKKNKNVDIVNWEPVPENLKFLPNSKIIKTDVDKKKKYDVAIILESFDVERIGGNLFNNINFNTVVNIDHHINRKGEFASYDLVDEKATSCCEIVLRLMDRDKNKLTKEEAICLYTGIVTDTGKFQQANTNSKAMLIGSRLISAGVDPVYIYKNVYATKTIESMKLLSLALSTLQKKGEISYITITKDMFLKTKAKQQDTEDIISYAGMIKGVKIYALFQELLNEKQTVKVSLRSYGNVDVNKIATQFSGGGHLHASGFKLKGKTIDECIKIVMPYLEKSIYEEKKCLNNRVL